MRVGVQSGALYIAKTTLDARLKLNIQNPTSETTSSALLSFSLRTFDLRQLLQLKHSAECAIPRRKVTRHDEHPFRKM